MICFDCQRPTPQHQLAADEALLDFAEEGRGGETLSFWEPDRQFVVVGYANHVTREVNVATSGTDGLPILRRCSGGGTVLQGPGCLNYALVLRTAPDGPLATIPGANRWIMERHRAALADALGTPVEVRGHTDLTLAGRKFSGNSQRRRRDYLLFHGCFLLGLDFALVERYLRMPSHQPAYRSDRSHGEFLINLRIPAERVRAALCREWCAEPAAAPAIQDRIDALVKAKYTQHDWNWKF